MFSSFRGFFDRHRHKIVITGALLGGAYALGKLAQWKLSDWYETQHVEFLVQSKKQLHFDGNQKTCNITFNSLLPSLKDVIFELVETEAITEKLKSKPSDKLLLWEQLKIFSFTRTVTSVYASSLLAVFLRVQLNLLGGYMYLDVESEGVEATPVESCEVFMSDPTQKKYLGIVRYFLETGVKDLVEAVQHVVEGVLGSVSLKQKLSYHDVKRMLGQIRQCLKFSHPEQSGGSTSSHLKISSIVLPSLTDEAGSFDKDKIFSQLLNETADILDSEDFQVVFNACLDVGFMFVMERMKSSFIVDQQDTPPDMICSLEDDLCSLHLPLAKICPVINGKAMEVFTEDRNDYLHDIVSLECVKSFAANIYEAFSNKPRN